MLITGLAALLAGAGVAVYLLRLRGPVLETKSSNPVASTDVKSPPPGVNRAGRQTTRSVPAGTAAEQPSPVPQNPLSVSTLSVPLPSVPVSSPVMFRVMPDGAKVQVDGRSEMECISPCALRLKNGRHTMLATASGFTLARRIFNVPEETDLPVVLERSMGLLLMRSDPSGCGVTVDGKASGQTPVTLRLTAGAHQIVVTNGAQRHEETVIVVADEFISRSLHWQ